MAQGIARLRQKDVVDSDEVTAEPYFPPLSNYVNQTTITVELAKCQHCEKDVLVDVLYNSMHLHHLRVNGKCVQTV